MAVINTNTKALFSQNALKVSGRLQAKAMEQLSTGKRINTAGDDAAGLAIATRMTQQIRALNQAVRNAGDAISLIQTAEGATNEITNMMQRMRELAIQAINDTNGDADRSYLDLEFQELKQEISRTAEMTEWNGFKVLDGTAGEPVGEVPVYKATSTNLSGDVLIDPTTVRTVGGPGGGEIKTLTLSGSPATGTIKVAGVSVTIGTAEAATLTAFATAVAATLTASSQFSSTSGRSVTASGAVLTFTYAATDGDVGAIEVDSGSTSVSAAQATTREAVVSTIETFSGNATFSRSGTLSIDVPSGTGSTLTAAFKTTDNESISLTGTLDRANGIVTFNRNDGNNRQVFSGALGTSSDTLVYSLKDPTGTAVNLNNRAVSLGIDVSGTVPALRAGDLRINGIDVGASYAADDLLSPRNNAAGSAIAKAAAINRVADANGLTLGESQTVTFSGVPKEGVIQVAGVSVTITAAEDTAVKAAAKVAAALKASAQFDVTTGRVVSYANGGSVISLDYPVKDGNVGTAEILPGTTGLVGIADTVQEFTVAAPGTGVYAKVNANQVSGRAMDANAVASGVVWINGYASAEITTVLNNTRETRQRVVEAINAISAQTGVKAIDTGADAKGITLLAQDGRNVEVKFETSFNAELFGRGIGLREGVQASTISLESKIQTPVVLSSATTGDITRVGLTQGNFTKNESVYSSAPRDVVPPSQAQVSAVGISGTAGITGTFSIVVNGTTVSATATGAQNARSALVTAINAQTSSLGVTASLGRSTGELLLTAVNPGTSFSVTTSMSTTAAASAVMAVTTVVDNMPASFKPLGSDDLVINGIAIRPSTSADDDKSSTIPLSSDRGSSAIAIAAAINSQSNETGVRAMANGAETQGLVTDTSMPESGIYTLFVNGVAVDVEFKKDEPEVDRRAKVVSAINSRVGQHGVSAKDNGYGLSLRSDGRNLSVWFDSNLKNLSAASFGLDKGDSVAQVSRIAMGGSDVAAITSVQVNGITITAASASTKAAQASALYDAVNAKILDGTLKNLGVRYTAGGTSLEIYSTVKGSPFDLRGAALGTAATDPTITVATVTENSMGSTDVTAIRDATATSNQAKTVYGTVRLMSDSAFASGLPSPMGPPPSDRVGLLKGDAKPFTVSVGNKGFNANGNFTALGFQEGAFGGRSSEAMDPPKVGRLAFQVGSGAQQLITIDLADFGKKGGITGDITGDVDLNVDQRTVRVNTRDGANTVLAMLDESMDKVNATRAQMGAVMNRLQYAMDNLSNVSTNQEASRSQIQDADYASASTELAKAQIMQQAATAVLAQANMSQQTVLQLLKG